MTINSAGAVGPDQAWGDKNGKAGHTGAGSAPRDRPNESKLLLRDCPVGNGGTVDGYNIVAACGDRSAHNRVVSGVVVDDVAGNADQPAGSRERRIVA